MKSHCVFKLPFGEELGVNVGGRTSQQGYGVGDGVRQQFTGQQRDNETGLDYFGARYFASTQGRFTSPDEFTGGPRKLFVPGSAEREKEQPLAYAHVLTPQSLNKYQYCLNNPLRYIDPDGHDWRIAEEEDSKHHKVRRYVWDDNYVYKKGDKNGAASNASFIDTQGRVIKLWGENGKDHGYQVVTEGEPGDNKEAKYTDQKGGPPLSYVRFGDTLKALQNAGYVQTIDPLHESYQVVKPSSPTLHIIVFFNTEIVEGPAISATEKSTLQVANVTGIEYHRDDYSQMKPGDLEKHMWEATKKIGGKLIP